MSKPCECLSPTPSSLFLIRSSLCAGSHRKPTSIRSEIDLALIPYFTPSNPSEGRDIRIRLLAEVFNATSQGLNVQPVEHTEIEKVHTEINSSLQDLSGLLRVVLPLSGKSFVLYFCPGHLTPRCSNQRSRPISLSYASVYHLRVPSACITSRVVSHAMRFRRQRLV